MPAAAEVGLLSRRVLQQSHAFLTYRDCFNASEINAAKMKTDLKAFQKLRKV
jgi:hypothetical protein